MAIWKVKFTKDNIYSTNKVEWKTIHFQNKKTALKQIEHLKEKGFICSMSILPTFKEIIKF